MKGELKNKFDILSLEQKMNQISSELIIIGELVKQIEKIYNVNSLLNVKNYSSSFELSNSDMLTFIYEDIYNIQKELIMLLTVMEIKHDRNF